MNTARRTPQDWIAAGFDALRESGAESLRAEILSRRIGTTKGSFYWHFKDVPAYRAALLDAWAGECDTMIDEALEAGAPARMLRALAESIATTRASDKPARAAEAAIRGWASSEPAVAAAVVRVDAVRRAALRALLHQLGVDNPEMPVVLLAAATGRAMLRLDAEDGGKGAPDGEIGGLVDLVLALRDL